MLKFNKKMVITGKEIRTKADKSTYTLIYVLCENGQTMGCVYRGESSLGDIEFLKSYDITFQITVGKYTNLSVVEVN